MKDDEKTLVPQVEAPKTRKGASNRILLCWALCAVLLLLPRQVQKSWFSQRPLLDPDVDAGGTCPQVNPILPVGANGELWADLSAIYTSQEYEERAVAWLGDAVRIPTELYDDMGLVGEDERWKRFGPFNEYLVEAFPKVCVLVLSVRKHRSLTAVIQPLELEALEGQHVWIVVRVAGDGCRPQAAPAHGAFRCDSESLPPHFFPIYCTEYPHRCGTCRSRDRGSVGVSAVFWPFRR